MRLSPPLYIKYRDMEKTTIPFIVKNKSMSIHVGQYNGYVAVSPNSAFFGLTIDDNMVENLDVHGGITFFEPVTNGEYSAMSHCKIKKEFVGKVCPVAEQAIRLDGIKEPIPKDWWILGFDTKHYNDNPQKWNKTSVGHETFNLEKQILKKDGLWDIIKKNAEKD